MALTLKILQAVVGDGAHNLSYTPATSKAALVKMIRITNRGTSAVAFPTGGLYLNTTTVVSGSAFNIAIVPASFSLAAGSSLSITDEFSLSTADTIKMDYVPTNIDIVLSGLERDL